MVQLVSFDHAGHSRAVENIVLILDQLRSVNYLKQNVESFRVLNVTLRKVPRSYHFVGLDIIRQEELVYPDEEMHEQNKNANGGEPLYLQTAHYRSNPLPNVNILCRAKFHSVAEPVDENDHHQNAEE